MASIQTLVGKNIRFFRKSKGLTQEYLAEQANVSASYIGYLERGQKSPSLELLDRMAQALDVNSAQLLQSAEDHDNPELHKLITLLSNKEPCHLKFLNEVATAYFKSLENINT